ncbi:MAG: hypothetical protein PHE88_08185 [Elusimicrobia bacterium]|nr:hypothetical protein [Elusimicrobiota bacterium]
MKKILLFILLLLPTLSFSRSIYISSEEEVKNIFTITTSTVSKDVFIIPSDLLRNLSDENIGIIKKLHSSNNSEFAATTYTEVILPLLFRAQLVDDVKEQIEKGKKVYSDIFGEKPRIFYPDLGIISKEVLGVVKKSDFKIIITSSGEQMDLDKITVVPEPDLSGWIGTPIQNLAWDYLKHARIKINEYTSSEAYNSEKFNAALEELYFLEKPVWFKNYVSDDANKNENDLWFRAGLSNMYRVMGYEPPDDISTSLFTSVAASPLINLTTSEYLVCFNDETDNVILSSCNIMSFGVKESSGNIIFDVFISSQESEIVDIYIDMNKRNNAGSTAFIPGHNGFTDSLSAWEYAISFSSISAYLYRYNITGPPLIVKEFHVENIRDRNLVEIKIPEKYIRGNPENWGYIIVGFLPSGDIFDIIGSDVPTSDTVIQIPALRMK